MFATFVFNNVILFIQGQIIVKLIWDFGIWINKKTGFTYTAAGPHFSTDTVSQTLFVTSLGTVFSTVSQTSFSTILHTVAGTELASLAVSDSYPGYR